MKVEPCPTWKCETLCSWRRVECTPEVTRRSFKCEECGKKFDVNEEPYGPEFFLLTPSPSPDTMGAQEETT